MDPILILSLNTGRLSLILGLALIGLCLIGFFSVYYIMKKKALEDTQLDRMIDLGKWVVVSVSMVVIVSVVADGFKEREQEMKELEYFDKYKDITLSIKGIDQKCLLADYFATVSPDGQFKRSWEAYREKIRPDYEKSDTFNQIQLQISQAQQQISTITDTTKRKILLAKNERVLDSISNLKAMIDKKYISIINTPQSALSGYKIEVFYTLDLGAESKPRAEKIYNLLVDRYPDCTVVLTPLSIQKNAQPGYNIQQNQIRYEANETDAFLELQSIINEANIFEKEAISGHQVKYYTPNYISVFVRNM